MEVTQPVTELEHANRLEKMLDRVHSGERFTIERQGVPTAAIARHSERRRATLRELALRLAALTLLDDEFEADVKASEDALLSPRDVEWLD